MGCGGSRADTIEPRYYESWTRETESTWLTNTDTEVTQTAIVSYSNSHQRGTNDSTDTAMKENTATCPEDSGHTDPVCTSSSAREKKMVNIGTQCGRQPFHSTFTKSNQKRPLQRDEVNLNTKKPSKEAVATKSVHHVSCMEKTAP
ncbi:BAALC binder of MAP3K1 and KLF4 a [Chanos chanos]|uniref:BAALC binder of MAP3K1 and KLF4 a n=1 Tax=Chanos chanos TaxID=29144 RepID=A0A6J2W6N0_CHACN|nr:brain and acute leukemia cytoplasmic protein [Chanos chanos]